MGRKSSDIPCPHRYRPVSLSPRFTEDVRTTLFTYGVTLSISSFLGGDTAPAFEAYGEQATKHSMSARSSISSLYGRCSKNILHIRGQMLSRYYPKQAYHYGLTPILRFKLDMIQLQASGHGEQAIDFLTSSLIAARSCISSLCGRCYKSILHIRGQTLQQACHYGLTHVLHFKLDRIHLQALRYGEQVIKVFSHPH